MNRLLFTTIVAAVLSLVAAATAAPPCCGTVYGPTYSRSTETWPQYSNWEYKRLEGNSGLFERFRFRRDNASSSTRETDEFAWALLGNGQYEQRGRLADLFSKAKDLLPQLGKSQGGYERSEYGLLKAFSYLAGPGLLNAKNLPEIPNSKDTIGPIDLDMRAREQNAFLLAKQGLEQQAQQQLSNNELRKAQIEATARLATVETLAKANERRLAESIRGILEADRQAAIQLEMQQEVSGDNLANIPTDNRELATLIQAKCWGCHGPTKQDGGLDFRQLATFNAAKWGAIVERTMTDDAEARMPKGGQPLTFAEIKPFRDEEKAAILRGN